jgi:hypothetical protein
VASGTIPTSIEVDFDNAVVDCGPEIIYARTGAAVENEEHRLGVVLGLELLGHELLVLAEELGVELDVTAAWSC